MMPKFTSHVLVSIFFLAMVLVLPAESLAEPLFSVTPKLSTTWRSDSNFYEAETTEHGVYTYLVQPGIELGVKTDKASLILDYLLSLNYYDDQDNVPAGQRAASDKDYTGHAAKAGVKFQPMERLRFGLDGSYDKTDDPGVADALTDSIDKEKYTITRYTPSIFFKPGPLSSVKLSFRGSDKDYDETLKEGESESRGTLELGYELTASTALKLAYATWNTDYQKTTSDYTSHQGMLTLNYKYSLISMELGAGYHDRDFDDGAVKDADMVIYKAAISAKNTRGTGVSLSSEWNFNDSGVGNQYYKAHKVTLRGDHVLMEKIPLAIGANYQKSDYEDVRGLNTAGATVDRVDDTWGYFASIGYKMTDWMTFTVKAGKDERDSNTVGNGYDNQYVMGKIDLRHNLGDK
ncbi:MAG: outer membrane beta-barrel protein [Desulfobacterales bacterium]|nr:outer membrane beta-barrel protein [Desulfobacterales bacterium]